MIDAAPRQRRRTSSSNTRAGPPHGSEIDPTPPSAVKRLSYARDSSGFSQKAGDPILDHLVVVSHVGRQDGTCACYCLDDRQRRPLVPGGLDKHVAVGLQSLHAIGSSARRDAIVRSVHYNPTFDAVPHRSLPKEGGRPVQRAPSAHGGPHRWPRETNSRPSWWT